MARTSVRVRPATAADIPALVELGAELRDQTVASGEASARGRSVPPAARTGLEARYCEALTDPERHLVVAVGTRRDGSEESLGMALFSISPANALLDLPAVHVSHGVVADRHRRRGAGKALVAAAAGFAEEHGLEQIVVSVHPGSRESNRFFARLGFAPLAVRRVAPVAVVRRSLHGEAPTGEHVIRRRPQRRRLMAGAGATLLPLRTREAEISRGAHS
ncbi:MAG TPA: GNAT family N-acetyltransferase [Mycobacteriales bacterium]|nr:GNAT family N-acetyltransferase [Mycobacteriales bacterium]